MGGVVLWLEGVWREEGECGVEWERVLAGRMLEREVEGRGSEAIGRYKSKDLLG